MSDTTTTTAGVQDTQTTDTTNQSTVTQTTDTQAPEPEKTLTQEHVTAIATRERKQGEAAILKELGLSTKEELAAIKELGITSKDGIAALKEVLAAHEAEKAKNATAADIQKAFDEYKHKTEAEKAAAVAEAEQARQEAWAVKAGIPEAMQEFYLFKINKLMASDSLDFKEASEKYLKENPVAQSSTENKPPMWGGTGTKPINTTMTQAEFNKLGYKERVALATENPTLYAQLSKG